MTDPTHPDPARPSARHRDRDSLRSRLRRIPALAGPLPALDLADVPGEPVELFLRWFEEALEQEVPEPHTLTVATVGPDGRPSSRVVVLDDVVDGGWRFATDTRSRKAQDLEARPQVALCFYWQPLGRQVRVEGSARQVAASASAEDFLSRSPASRVAALAARPGEPLAELDDLAAATRRATEQIERSPGLVLGTWVVYEVEPMRVEFWQGSGDRAHRRLVYERDEAGWSSGMRWP
ncbi:pyridoxal 5'-phosphate synthase [Actinotalea sp. BY-33]|uniref:Pyridoxal 5'-phosphate synthase n=1 Tax=Actinotalea soli TaxID=2819234 RepID=A0A939LRE8_9CELL|nr:pyridoxal 5'-phosphate synthase [Actinotalea soli]MBO1750769.1 pyridoxal 5'-phosphate synthase [Actinotalea soli]